MTKREEFRLYMKAANGTSENHRDGHLNEERMLAYCRGAIPAAEREAAEAHLVDCAQCVALFRSARHFLEPAREDEAIDKADLDRAWQSTWARAQAEVERAGATTVARTDIQLPNTPKVGLGWLTPWWRPALAFVLLALIAGGLIYASFNSGTKVPEKAQQEAPAAAPGEPPAKPQHETPSAPDPSAPSPPSVSEDVVAVNIKARRGSGFEDSATRGEREDAARTSLLTARKIFLAVTGHEPTSGLLSDRLKERLPASGRFLLTTDPAEAEVALKIEAEAARTDATRVSFIARVVGADGKTLWPLIPGVVARRYQGQSKKAADRLLSDLLDDIQRMERKH